MTACTAHTLALSRALLRVGSMPWLAGPIVPSTNLDESLARCKESSRAWPCLLHDAMEFLVRHVAAPHPNHLRRRAMLSEQLREVIIFCDDHNQAVCTPGLRENDRIAGAQQTQFLDVDRVKAVFRSQPSCQSRRQLGINPDLSCRGNRVTFAHSAAILV
jgi:hypothetical protein